jgi:hypothetical protein
MLQGIILTVPDFSQTVTLFFAPFVFLIIIVELFLPLFKKHPPFNRHDKETK